MDVVSSPQVNQCPPAKYTISHIDIRYFYFGDSFESNYKEYCRVVTVQNLLVVVKFYVCATPSTLALWSVEYHKLDNLNTK